MRNSKAVKLRPHRARRRGAPPAPETAEAKRTNPAVADRQRGVRLPIGDLEGFWRRICAELGLAPGAATICFVSTPQMARWNRAYRGKSGPTDVLSFPAKPRRSVAVAPRPHAPRDDSEYLGDIAIAPAVARRNARRFGRTFGQELRILMLHGALHLLGYDHERDRGEMERLEGRVRRRLGLES